MRYILVVDAIAHDQRCSICLDPKVVAVVCGGHLVLCEHCLCAQTDRVPADVLEMASDWPADAQGYIEEPETDPVSLGRRSGVQRVSQSAY
jgi:hypothetical protein